MVRDDHRTDPYAAQSKLIRVLASKLPLSLGRIRLSLHFLTDSSIIGNSRKNVNADLPISLWYNDTQSFLVIAAFIELCVTDVCAQTQKRIVTGTGNARTALAFALSASVEPTVVHPWKNENNLNGFRLSSL